jgi:hypothetical protein
MLYPWEIGPMREVVEQTGMVVIHDPYPLTHYTYRLSCGDVVQFPMPDRKAVACNACGDIIRADQERQAAAEN